jgi:hypothetical protein
VDKDVGVSFRLLPSLWFWVMVLGSMSANALQEGWGLMTRDFSDWRNPGVKDVLAPIFQVTQGP